MGGEKAGIMDILEALALGTLEQEDYCKFKASMGYSVRPWQNKERRKRNKHKNPWEGF